MLTSIKSNVCPHCKRELIFSDDIVICSKCNIPHHKTCWIENQGCSSDGCMGGIQTIKDLDKNNKMYLQQPTTVSSDIIYCHMCGKLNDGIAKFCSNCGATLLTQALEPEPIPHETNMTKNPQFQSNIYNSENNTFDEDMMMLIGKNATYYVEKFKVMDEKKTTISWNWASFFFSAYWFMYRKMYAAGLIIIVIISFAPLTTTIQFISWSWDINI